MTLVNLTIVGLKRIGVDMNKGDKNAPINNQSRFRRWLREIVLTVVVLIVVGLALDYFRLSQRDSRVVSRGELAVITAQLTAPQQLEFSQGKPLLVYVWATWCGVCNLTSGAVNALHNEGELVVSIASKSGSLQKVQAHLDDKEYQFPVYNDEQGLFGDALGVKGTPTFFIVNKHGEILFYSMGVNTETGLRVKLAFFK